MTRRTTTHEKVRPRSRLRRFIVFGTLGVLLGVLAVLFFSHIHNPFGEQIESPLVLIPESADFVLSIPDFPDFLGKLRDRPFVESLDDHDGFQAFLKTKAARDTGVVDALRAGFAALDEVGTSLPLGLDLLGDVSGTHVLVCGYLRDRVAGSRPDVIGKKKPRSDADVRFMLVFQPDSWKSLAGVNILLDETLCGWFMRDSIESQGLRIEHRRDLAMIELPAETPGASPRQLWITRIADTVLVSTEERELARIFNFVQQKGLPRSPASRYQSLRDRYGGAQAKLLFRRKRMDRYLKHKERLLALWGSATLNFAESLLPRMGGEDMVVELDVGRGFGMAFAGQVGAEKKGDLSTVLRPFSAPALRADHGALKDFLPNQVFATIRLEAPLGEVCEVLIKRDNLFTAEDRKDLREMFQAVPGLGGLEGLLRKLTEVTEPELTVAFFKQDREVLAEEAEPGQAIVAPITDEAGLRQLLSLIDRDVQNRRGEGTIKQIYTEERGGVSLYKPVLTSGVVDDPRVTIPGLAIVDGHLVITNFFPFLRDIPKVLAGTMEPMGGAGFDVALSYAPQSMLFAAVIDNGRLQPYLEQSAPGWAFLQTSPTQDDMGAWREEFAARAVKQGIPKGTRQFSDFVDSAFRRRYADLTEVQREAKLRGIEEHLQHFDGLIRGTGLFVETGTGDVRMSLRIELETPEK